MLRPLRLPLLASIPPLLAVAALTTTSSVAFAQSCGAWTRVPASDPGSFSMLKGLAVISPADVWTVGGGGFQHDTGRGFALVAAPSLGSLRGGARAIAGDASNDVWADGETHPAQPYAPTSTLVERYTGSSWAIVPSPSPDAKSNVLQGAVALAPTNVWAIGQSAGRALIEHFDGSAWTVASAPAPGTGSSLAAVAAAGPGAIKAVGWFRDAAGTHPLVLSFDGTTWSRDGTPSGAPVLTTIAHVPGTSHFVASGGSTTDSLLRFDGTSWSTRTGAGTPFADSPGEAGWVGAIDAVSDTDVWLVGSYTGSVAVYNAQQPFALRTDGTAWTSTFRTFSVDQGASALVSIGHAGGTMRVAGYYSPTTTSYGEVFAAAAAC